MLLYAEAEGVEPSALTPARFSRPLPDRPGPASDEPFSVLGRWTGSTPLSRTLESNQVPLPYQGSALTNELGRDRSTNFAGRMVGRTGCDHYDFSVRLRGRGRIRTCANHRVGMALYLAELHVRAHHVDPLVGVTRSPRGPLPVSPPGPKARETPFYRGEWTGSESNRPCALSRPDSSGPQVPRLRTVRGQTVPSLSVSDLQTSAWTYPGSNREPPPCHSGDLPIDL